LQEVLWRQKIIFPFLNFSFECHFCLASLSCESLEIWGKNYLHPLEFWEHENLTNKRRKHDYLLRNYCVKQVILPCLKKPLNYAKHLHISKEINQQAFLMSDRIYHSHLQISITHSETLGFAVAFEGLYPLGIDIEKINLQKFQSIESLMTSEEKGLTKDFIHTKELNAIILWTAKEALCKAVGGGLSVFSEITQVIGIFSNQSYTEILFKHLSGYRAYSFLFEDYIITIAFPYTKRFEIDLHPIWKKLKEDMKLSIQSPNFWHESLNERKRAVNS